MVATRGLSRIVAIILLSGTLLSALFVLVGGVLYLLQHHGEPMEDLIPIRLNIDSMREIMQFALSHSPSGLIELGLLLLVFTQMIRILTLSLFYAAAKDYKFLCISIYILIMLVYSFFR